MPIGTAYLLNCESPRHPPRRVVISCPKSSQPPSHRLIPRHLGGCISHPPHAFMGEHLEPALPRYKRRIDLSRDSHTVFRSRRNPTAPVSPKQSELPMSSSPMLGKGNSLPQTSPDRSDHSETEQIDDDLQSYQTQDREATPDTKPSLAAGSRSTRWEINKSVPPQSPPSCAGPSKPRLVVEDVTDSQWEAIAQSTVERRRQRREKKGQSNAVTRSICLVPIANGQPLRAILRLRLCTRWFHRRTRHRTLPSELRSLRRRMKVRGSAYLRRILSSGPRVPLTLCTSH